MQINSDEKAAIEAILERQAVAWAAGDAEVVFTNVVGMFSVGRAPFVSQHARILDDLQG